MFDTLDIGNISFSYNDAPVLHDVSHQFAPGKLTVICGPNGSGKSTLLHIASGLVKPTTGAVKLGAHIISEIPAGQRAQRLAMLPQSPEAPSELTVNDLVALGRYAYRKPFAGLSTQDKSAITGALAKTNLNGLGDRTLAQLSGGQRQRSWIALVLAQEAPLFLLDEPTNHLDIAHAFETMLLLQKLVREENKTVVVVLHDINLMTAFAEEVVLMKAGKIIAAGAYEDAVTEHVLSDLYGRRCTFGTVANRDRPFVVVS
ncbi:ABC transporter ATP-binding protein [Loktanella agnita]|uniref:ABC transporter ATP-binding protein n=1 Tax=Loktanella agnita TaxID=287097 RepID=UPI00398637DE